MKSLSSSVPALLLQIYTSSRHLFVGDKKKIPIVIVQCPSALLFANTLPVPKSDLSDIRSPTYKGNMAFQ